MITFLTVLLWTVLGIESFVGLSFLISSVDQRIRQWGQTIPRRLLDQLPNCPTKTSSTSDDRVQQEQQWIESRLCSFPLLLTCFKTITNRRLREHRWGIIDEEIEQHFRWADHPSLYVCKSAPLVGLGLTFLGVIEALQAFQSDPGDLGGLIQGFYTALASTVIGVVVTLITLGGRSLYQSAKKNDRTAIEQVLIQLDIWFMHIESAEEITTSSTTMAQSTGEDDEPTNKLRPQTTPGEPSRNGRRQLQPDQCD